MTNFWYGCGAVILVVYGFFWHSCSSRGGEFVKQPFEIYRCTK